MTYLDCIIEFRLLHLQQPFSLAAQAVFYALLHEWNLRRWPAELMLSNVQFAASVGADIKTVKKGRDELAARGIIGFKSGDSKKSRTVYYGKFSHSSDEKSASNCGKISHKPDPKTGVICGKISHSSSLFNCNKIRLDKIELQQLQQRAERSSVEEEKENFPPDRKTVADYIRQQGYSFDADAFFDYYSANGWMCGKRQMADWRAACSKWEREEQRYNKRRKSEPSKQRQQLQQAGENLSVRLRREREVMSDQELMDFYFAGDFNQEVEALCRQLGISKEDLKTIAEEVLNDWKLTGERHGDSIDQRRHFLSHIRAKARAWIKAVAQSVKATSNQRADKAAKAPRSVNDRWANYKLPDDIK